MWYKHTKNPISLINFLHVSQKGLTELSLSFKDKLSSFDRWGNSMDRQTYFWPKFDHSCWGFMREQEEEKRRGAYFSNKNTLSMQYFCSQLTFPVDLCSGVITCTHTDTRVRRLVFLSFARPRTDTQTHAKHPFDNSGEQIWWEFMRRCAIKLLSP